MIDDPNDTIHDYLKRLLNAIDDCETVAGSTAEDKAKVEMVAHIHRWRVLPALNGIGLHLDWDKWEIGSTEEVATYVQALQKLMGRLGDLAEEH
jgi:hypothetical protein